MPTNEERREVARNLRKLHLGGGSNDLIELTLSDATGSWHENGMSWDYITERLADLIEPEPERTCKMVETRWDNGQSVWGCQCTQCGEKFEYENGHTWRFCPECGAKVVN